MPRETRAAFLDQIADQIEARTSHITRIGSAETGLPRRGFWQSRGADNRPVAVVCIPYSRWRVFRSSLRSGASRSRTAAASRVVYGATLHRAGCPVVVKGHSVHPCTADIVVKISGKTLWLWRAVDQHCVVLDEMPQSRRDKPAAKKVSSQGLETCGSLPERINTDKLCSYGTAKRDLMPWLDHWSHKWLKNRDENSHLPVPKRERVMQIIVLRAACNASRPSIPQSAIVSLFQLADVPP